MNISEKTRTIILSLVVFHKQNCNDAFCELYIDIPDMIHELNMKLTDVERNLIYTKKGND